MKYTYQLQVHAGDDWTTTLDGGSLAYMRGYLDCKKEIAPRLAHRIIRSDGEVIEEIDKREDVYIGQVAGFPTSQQFEQAAQRALARARSIRESVRNRKSP